MLIERLKDCMKDIAYNFYGRFFCDDFLKVIRNYTTQGIIRILNELTVSSEKKKIINMHVCLLI